MIEQDGAVLVHDTLGIFPRPNEASEIVEQAGGLKRALAGVGVNVEQATLFPGGEGGLSFIDGDIDAVSLKHASKREAAKAGTNNGNGWSHQERSMFAASFDADGCFGDAGQPCHAAWNGVYAAA